ncbi:MAG: hypothetical protein U0840_09760 [Gemmataceae bacterium]
MRRTGAGCLAVLGLSIATTMLCAQSPAKKYSPKASETTSSWWKGWFGSGKEEAQSATPPPSLTVADRAMELDRLMRAYWRRQEICDRLRDIALQQNDNSLYEEASRLEEMAWRLHQQRSNKLLGLPVANAIADEEEAPPEPSTVDVLKRASKGGQLPPRLQPGKALAPTQANRDVRQEEER